MMSVIITGRLRGRPEGRARREWSSGVSRRSSSHLVGEQVTGVGKVGGGTLETSSPVTSVS